MATLLVLLLPLAAAGSSLQAGGWTGSWCADHDDCWWYETCHHEPGFDGPCMGWLTAQHRWTIDACAGASAATLAWAAIAPEEQVAGHRDLAPHECVRIEEQGTFPLVDCYVLAATLVPSGAGEIPLYAATLDCGLSVDG